jgi:phosphate transport system protein
MTNLERELKLLKEEVVDMMLLVHKQLEKSKVAFVDQDISLSKEIHRGETRVNALELSIDKDCENIIALYNPVASDLRLVLATLKITTNLERIGDHADKICRYVRKKEIIKPYDPKLLAAIGFEEIFNTALEMVEDAIRGFHEENTNISRGVFIKDETINEGFKKATSVLSGYRSKIKDPEEVAKLLYLFSILNKLERVGDLAKNIAEETIFYVEAQIFKDPKKKKRKK